MKNKIDQLIGDIFSISHKKYQRDVILPKDEDYRYMLETYSCGEIYPDVKLFSFNEFCKENKYLIENFNEVSESYFIIGDNAQGDTWYLSKENIIFFYDHNDGDYDLKNFQNLGINFIEFIEICLIIKKYEDSLSTDDSKELQLNFISELDNIKKGIYDIFPYAYF